MSNATNIIQLGLALCDDNGNLPDFGTTDFWNLGSIYLLIRQGIDFDKIRQVIDRFR